MLKIYNSVTLIKSPIVLSLFTSTITAWWGFIPVDSCKFPRKTGAVLIVSRGNTKRAKSDELQYFNFNACCNVQLVRFSMFSITPDN